MSNLDFPPKIMKKAFTLVELIVVITILAILWTIAFISLQWYSRDARDSTRTADISNIKTSLELFSLQTWKYPTPDNFSTITYSWTAEDVWYQWTLWQQVTTNLKQLDEIPLDPLMNTEYIYSVTNSYKEYEVLSLYEWSVAYNQSPHSISPKGREVAAIFPQTYAAWTLNLTPKVAWTYNGVFVKTKSYIIPTPSIITAEPGNILLDWTKIKSQVITNGKNIPNIWTAKTNTWALNVNFIPYTWSINKSSSTWAMITAMKQIQKAYSWTSLAINDTYSYILNQTTDTQLIALWNNTILKWSQPLVVSNNSNTTPPAVNTDFVSTWNVWIDTWVSWFNNLKLPLQNNWTYNFTVDWWDWTSNIITTWNQPEATHSYSSAWPFDVTITWTIDWFAFNAWIYYTDNMDDWDKLIDIKQWWPVKISDWWQQFSNVWNLVSFSATDIPDLTWITNMTAMFANSNNFNWNISNWNISSSPTRMDSMFSFATSFNQPLNLWNISSVWSINEMFNGATNFNQDISWWDTSSANNMSNMFRNATSFNQDLSSWNVSPNISMCTNFSLWATAYVLPQPNFTNCTP